MEPFVLLSVQSGLLLTSAWNVRSHPYLHKGNISPYIVQSYTGEYYKFVAEFVYMWCISGKVIIIALDILVCGLYLYGMLPKFTGSLYFSCCLVY